MAFTTFDTLKFVKRLKEAGVPEKEAEAISEAFKEVQGELDLATKRDLKELEMRMIKKFGLTMVIAIGVITAIVKLA